MIYNPFQVKPILQAVKQHFVHGNMQNFDHISPGPALISCVQIHTTCIHTCSCTHVSLIPLHTHTHDYTQFGTALHFALAGEHEDIVQLLLEAKIDPDLPKQVCHLT